PKRFHHRLTIPELFEMRDRLRRFETEPEVRRRFRRPVGKRLEARDGSKGVVALGCRKMLTVVSEHFLCGNVGRIKFPFPLWVRKTGCADPDHFGFPFAPA